MKKLRIAEVSTIWETTPPKLYGGTERVVYDLTEELVRRGHKVTLFATGDSKTSANLESTYPHAAYRDGVSWENFLYPLAHVAAVFERAHEFDIIHIHLNRSQDYAALAFAGLVRTPTVFTLHFMLPTPEQKSRADRMKFLLTYKNRNFVSISNAQRTLDLNYAATVYNGLDFSKSSEPKKICNDLIWIGRFTPDKGPREAIEAAIKSGERIILAGKIDELKQESFDYYKKEIEPLIDGKQIVYVGEINDMQKYRLLKRAKAFLNPINWNEPFGLTVIEAMAAGVPVIAFDRGSMKELILDGKTGFIVKTVKEMVKAIKKTDTLNRKLIRQYALSHFSLNSMADSYEKVFGGLIGKLKKK